MKNLFTHWKTSLQSVLTVVIIASAASPLYERVNPKVSGWLFAVGSTAKLILGAFQTDGLAVPAGTTVHQTTTLQTPPQENA